jgi:hypothetical protein
MTTEPKPSDGSSDSSDPLQGAPGLEYYEAMIDRAQANQDSVEFALLEIHDRKLYLKVCGSFADYAQRRWRLSRARVYQLLHYARVKKLSTVVDGAPANERQARRLDAEGKVMPERKIDFIWQAMRYLIRTFERVPRGERREFLETICKLMADMEKDLGRSADAERGSVGPG